MGPRVPASPGEASPRVQLVVPALLHIVKEPISKKCVIKGDNLCVTGPTKNLHILNAEVVRGSVWGAVFEIKVVKQVGAEEDRVFLGEGQESWV